MKYCLVLTLMISEAGLAQICAPAGVVRPTAQLTATLDASNCVLADGTWFADYLIDFPSAGTWSAAVTPSDGVTLFSLVLRNQEGARIDSGPIIRRNVERGAYHVLVNASAPNQGGSFQFTSSFSGTANILCTHFAMLGTIRPVSGSLGAGSCTLPDGSPFDGYNLTLYGTGTVDIAVKPVGFAPLLILRTSDGHAIASNSQADDSGMVHLIATAVGSDTYTVVLAAPPPDAGSQDPSHGTYTVTASFTPDADETCASVATLSASQQYAGTVSTGSCNFSLPGHEDSTMFNYYNIHTGQPGVVQASLDTADFSSRLLLLDADGNTVADDLASGGSGTPLIRRQLQAGDYRLIVLNEDSFGGNYTLNYQYATSAAPACSVIPIDSGNQTSGILAATSSCLDSVFLADVYKIVLPSDGTVNLSLTSPDFSTFLDLHDGKDNALTWSIQSSGGSASFLSADLPAGTYYVDAASIDLPGGYAFSYTFTAKTLPVCPGPRQMPPNGFIHNAQLGSGSCTGPDGRRADFYRFTLPAASTEGVFMTSGSILPDVTLYQNDGTPLRTDQNSYAGNNAVVVQYLPAGDYLVRARSADPSGEGPYNLDLLSVPGAPPQLCAPRTLPLQGSVAGITSINSCAWYDKTLADVYQLDVTDASQSVTISSNSDEFDTFLVLLDHKANLIAFDDNGGGGTNSQLVQSLDPGTYYIIVKPADNPTSAGSYVLTSSAMPVPVPQNRARQ